MKTRLIVLCGALAVASAFGAPDSDSLQAADDVCTQIAKDLPPYCRVSPAPYCTSISCVFNFFNLDTLGFDIDFDICSDPIYANLTVNDTKIDFNYKTQLDIGDYQIAIPGLSVSVPFLGAAGVYVDVQLAGSKSNITVEVGVDACVKVVGVQKCEPNPPFQLIRGTYDMSGVPCPPKRLRLL